MFSPFQKVSIVIGIILCLFSSAFAYSGGSGEPNDPYQIAVVSDWNDLMNTSADWNKHFIMTADVNLQGVALTPVGNDANRFTGIFNGNGHIIRSVNINMPTSDNVGLFGYLDYGQICNLGVVDVNITGWKYVGGLVGYSKGGTITACYAAGVVFGDDFVGGLVGCNVSSITNCYSTAYVTGYWSVGGLVGDNGGYITNCYSTAYVTGYWSVGGLVGDNGGCIANCYSMGVVEGDDTVGGLAGDNYGGTITACYATGTVSGGDYVGGLVGEHFGRISDCYATGAIAGNTYVGGLVGENYKSHISNCYATGAVTGNTYVGGLAGENCVGTVTASFWDIETSGRTTSAAGTGKTTAEMRTLSTFTSAGWDFVTGDDSTGVWVMPENDYPHFDFEYWRRGKIPDVNGMSFEEAVDTIKNAGFLMWFLSSTNSQTVPVGYVVSQDPSADSNGILECTEINVVISCPNQINAGSGTETDPYQIRTVYEWLFLTCHPELWGKYFILMNDLDFRHSAIPSIGNDSTFFTGGFDGNGHIIHNVVINQPCRNCIGLFGYIKGGRIRNLGIENANIIGWSYVGGLVGRNYKGTITGSYVTGAVYGHDNVGGLVGQNEQSTIINCYTTGIVTKSRFTTNNLFVGGLVGYNYESFIADCYATSVVSGSSYVGGLVGVNYNGRVGRIVDYSCFWDIETSGQTVSAGGEGKTTAEMKTRSTFTLAGWDFVGETANGTEDIWTICEGINYPKFVWQNQPPIANAGADQTAYAWIDGIAEVDLDGLGSSDADCNELTYYWSWVIDGNTYEANGVNPAIELPVGVHTIQLIVNDGLADSVPDDVNITVVSPLRSALGITPRIINRCSRQSYIFALVRMPNGIMKKDISNEPLILYPSEIEASKQWVVSIPYGFGRNKKWLTEIFAFFDKDAVVDAIPANGRVELKVAGELTCGRYFYGSDTVIIIGPRRPCHFPKR